MNYADIKTVDIQDGEGVRVSIYVSGCHFHCKGCHNPEAWDFHYGKKFDESTIEYILDLMNHEYIAGLSLLGGEPLELANQEGLLPLVKKVKEKFPNKNIWCYTGYNFEKDVLGKMYQEYSLTKDLLENIDIMVDGEFEEENKIVDLKFRGSTNQKKIDVKASLKEGKVVALKFGDEERYEIPEKEVAKPKILFYEEFKKKNTMQEYVVTGISEEQDMHPHIVPLNVPIEIQEVEEKISAENKDKKMTHHL